MPHHYFFTTDPEELAGLGSPPPGQKKEKKKSAGFVEGSLPDFRSGVEKELDRLREKSERLRKEKGKVTPLGLLLTTLPAAGALLAGTKAPLLASLSAGISQGASRNILGDQALAAEELAGVEDAITRLGQTQIDAELERQQFDYEQEQRQAGNVALEELRQTNRVGLEDERKKNRIEEENLKAVRSIPKIMQDAYQNETSRINAEAARKNAETQRMRALDSDEETIKTPPMLKDALKSLGKLRRGLARHEQIKNDPLVKYSTGGQNALQDPAGITAAKAKRQKDVDEHMRELELDQVDVMRVVEEANKRSKPPQGANLRRLDKWDLDSVLQVLENVESGWISEEDAVRVLFGD